MISPNREFLKTLRQQTHNAHMEVENVVNIPDKISSKASYKKLIAKFYGFYKPIEIYLKNSRVLIDQYLSLDQRMKTPWLYQDLTALGCHPTEIDEIPLFDTPLHLATTGELLGCLYVLEGSTLGGQLISKMLRENSLITPETGGRFFAGYGAETSQMWRSFGDVVCEHAVTKEIQNEIIACANQTFAHFKGWIA